MLLLVLPVQQQAQAAKVMTLPNHQRPLLQEAAVWWWTRRQ
jgi:hypothetical protein